MAKRLVQPIREPASALDAAVDRVYAAKKEVEWQETVRLAEAIFPKDWRIRVEQFGDRSFVEVRITVADGIDPIAALKQAIEWYRGQSKIVIPSSGLVR